MYKKIEKGVQDIYPSMYPEICPIKKENKVSLITKSITIIVTEQCNLRCSYCYQHNKNSTKLTEETGYKIIDFLFEQDLKNSYLINEHNAYGIILDFIGGEPLLEIELIDKIVHYFRWKAIKLNHRWAIHHVISISTNGILYNTPAVQNFVAKNKDKLSLTITIDGNKELHDSCRKFPDGKPSYDIVKESVLTNNTIAHSKTSKLTIAPANVRFLSNAIQNLKKELNFDGIYANCVYEEGWDNNHATILYNELKKISDWMIYDNMQENFYCSLFDETIGKQLSSKENNNWCGGTGEMLSFTPDGNIQPCLRYTHFNLNDKQPEMRLGNLIDGLLNTTETINNYNKLEQITRRSQSTDECYNCPIASGCSWCSAYNYEIYGTPNKRTTFICPMHKARVLANIYYWNKTYKKYKIDKKFEMNCPKEWALKIIPENEYEMLCNLTK